MEVRRGSVVMVVVMVVMYGCVAVCFVAAWGRWLATEVEPTLHWSRHISGMTTASLALSR